MKTKHKRRWQKDYTIFNRVINRLEPFNPDELLKLELPIRMGFEAIKTGKGTEQDFHDIAAAMNTSLVRSEDVDPLCVAVAQAACDALMRTWERYLRTGRFGFDGPALAEVEAGIDLHEQLVRLSTPEQMMKAMLHVMKASKRYEATA